MNRSTAAHADGFQEKHTEDTHQAGASRVEFASFAGTFNVVLEAEDFAEASPGAQGSKRPDACGPWGWAMRCLDSAFLRRRQVGIQAPLTGDLGPGSSWKARVARGLAGEGQRLRLCFPARGQAACDTEVRTALAHSLGEEKQRRCASIGRCAWPRLPGLPKGDGSLLKLPIP